MRREKKELEEKFFHPRLSFFFFFLVGLQPRPLFSPPSRPPFRQQRQTTTTMAADGQSFAISLGLNFLFLAVIYFLFAVLRDAAPTKKFYAPRRYMRAGTGAGAGAGDFSSPASSPLRSGGAGGGVTAGGARAGGASSGGSAYPSSSTGKRPKRLPTGWFAWIGVVHRATQEDVIGVAGMDAAVYLAFLKLCEFVFRLFVRLFSSSSNFGGEKIKLTLRGEKTKTKKKTLSFISHSQSRSSSSS